MKGVQKRMGDLSSLAKLIIAVGVFLVLGGGLLQQKEPIQQQEAGSK
jgi:hypothetical protein